MSCCTSIIVDAVRRLHSRDLNLEYINLCGKRYTDQELVELIDCLLTHPNIIKVLDLGNNHLTDETGVKLAQYLLASTTIEIFGLYGNQISETTYLAIAAALKVNTSLRRMYLYFNSSVDVSRVDAAFVDALIINPNRPDYSHWRLFSPNLDCDYNRLKTAAEELGHPSMQALLAI